MEKLWTGKVWMRVLISKYILDFAEAKEVCLFVHISYLLWLEISTVDLPTLISDV